MNVRFFLGALALLALASCSDDNKETPTQTGGDGFISVLMANPDGNSGSGYMQVVDGIKPASYDNSKAVPNYFGLPPYVYGKNVYVMPSTNSDVITKYVAENGSLDKIWSISVPDGSNANFILENGEKAYMVFSNSGIIRVINQQTGETVKDIDLSSLAYKDKNPDIGVLVIRGNELYAALTQAQMYGIYPYADYKTIEVAIIDLSTYQVKKVIKQSTANMSNPTKIICYNSMFIDENNDIYITCNGSFGMYKDHRIGILRIKNGEEEFDSSYIFDMKELKIEDDGNTFSYFDMMSYAGDGKLYAQVHVPAYENAAGYNPLKDRTELPVLIDLKAKTVKAVKGIPRSNGYAASVGAYNEFIVFGIASETANGFYTYNTRTGESSADAVIKTTGYPYIFRQLK